MTRYTRSVVPHLLTGGRLTDFALRRFAKLRRVALKPTGLNGWEDDGGRLAAPVVPTAQATPPLQTPGSR